MTAHVMTLRIYGGLTRLRQLVSEAFLFRSWAAYA